MDLSAVIDKVILWLGAFCFGLVMGWVTYRTLRRSAQTAIGDIASVIGAIGGATVVGLFPKDNPSFGLYCIGLTIGFFYYRQQAMKVATAEGKSVDEWLGGRSGQVPPPPPTPPPPVPPAGG